MQWTKTAPEYSKKVTMHCVNLISLTFFLVLCSRSLNVTNEKFSIRNKDTVLFHAINGVKACFSYFKVSFVIKKSCQFIDTFFKIFTKYFFLKSSVYFSAPSYLCQNETDLYAGEEILYQL